MTPRSQAIPAEDAVRCRVLSPYLIFDQMSQRQVAPDSIVLVHPGTVRGWIRNGWIEVADTDAGEEEVPADADQDAESDTKKPTAPRRRANRNAQAAK